jgi:hypothetical protein
MPFDAWDPALWVEAIGKAAAMARSAKAAVIAGREWRGKGSLFHDAPERV